MYVDKTKFLQRGIDWLADHPANWAQGMLGSDRTNSHCILGAAVRCSLRSSKFKALEARMILKSCMGAKSLMAVESELAQFNDDAKSLAEAIDNFVIYTNERYGTRLVPRQPRRNISAWCLEKVTFDVRCAKHGCKNKALHDKPAKLCLYHFQEWFNKSDDSDIYQWLSAKSKVKKRAK